MWPGLRGTACLWVRHSSAVSCEWRLPAPGCYLAVGKGRAGDWATPLLLLCRLAPLSHWVVLGSWVQQPNAQAPFTPWSLPIGQSKSHGPAQTPGIQREGQVFLDARSYNKVTLWRHENGGMGGIWNHCCEKSISVCFTRVKKCGEPAGQDPEEQRWNNLSKKIK